MEELDIRWKQRFSNFGKSYLLLEKAVVKSELNEIEKAGIVQVFEMTFELAWKTLKDYLVQNNVDVRFPRDVIKESFRYELITDGETWMDMLEKRNLLSHTYDEATVELVLMLIRGKYFSAISQVYQFLLAKI
ncbi:MAG TPA: nucleotidyltransferase substrate binding protein [Bacteroidales bacterium]|jgi:nucleotidyltransferase substrate binding protein (TIGR01987 family)|nr:nucleotidyltransferase substrate binding protein [Bacteroidales bacterium]